MRQMSGHFMCKFDTLVSNCFLLPLPMAERSNDLVLALDLDIDSKVGVPLQVEYDPLPSEVPEVWDHDDFLVVSPSPSGCVHASKGI